MVVPGGGRFLMSEVPLYREFFIENLLVRIHFRARRSLIPSSCASPPSSCNGELGQNDSRCYHILRYSSRIRLMVKGLGPYRGASLTRKGTPQDPTVGLCVGSKGVPRGSFLVRLAPL